MVKNPCRWQEADQMVIEKCGGWGAKLWEQLQLAVRAGLEPGPPDYKFGALTTWPRCLLLNFSTVIAFISASRPRHGSFIVMWNGVWRKVEGKQKTRTGNQETEIGNEGGTGMYSNVISRVISFNWLMTIKLRDKLLQFCCNFLLLWVKSKCGHSNGSNGVLRSI